MNYSGVNWTSKTAITKTDLDTMDAGIKAASKELEDIKSSVIALKNSNIQRGYYVFSKGTNVDSNRIASTIITTPYSFAGNPTIIAVLNTSRPDNYLVSIDRIKDSTDSFTIYLYASTNNVADNKLRYDIGVHWIAIS